MAYLKKFGIREVALNFMNQEHEETVQFISKINKSILAIENTILIVKKQFYHYYRGCWRTASSTLKERNHACSQQNFQP